jgi:DNA-binding IscR family transcriptional regulator
MIHLKEVLDALGGRLYDTTFCDTHTGILNICTHSIDCSIRSIWKNLQGVVDDVLMKITLKDLVGNEEDLRLHMNRFNSNLEIMLN